jgi:hypothetical protein
MLASNNIAATLPMHSAPQLRPLDSQLQPSAELEPAPLASSDPAPSSEGLQRSRQS